MILTSKIWQPVAVFQKADTDALIDTLLEARGIVTDEEKSSFAENKPEIWYDPFLYKDMDKAVDLIVHAVQTGKKILVYGDYDCDGVTATSILVRFFRSHDCNVSYIVPHRAEHGYGLTDNILDKVIEESPDLVITVDCGITNIETVDELKNRGIKVIVSDHHNVKDEIPDADAVICAKRSDNTYPFKDLCGAGVALKIVEALGRDKRCKVSPDIWRQTIELAGIATIADLVSVTDENRTLIKKAFKSMENAVNPGIRIMNSMLLDYGKKLDETFISFNFVPRINAAGRLYDSSDALRLFLEDDEKVVTNAARALSRENDERKAIEAGVFEEALRQIQNPARPEIWQLTNLKGPIVVYAPGWHQGVLGIVAGRISQHFRRTAIVFTDDSIDTGCIKGSGRAYGEDDLYSSIEALSDIVENFGGHKKAAGVVVAKKNLGLFMKRLEENAAENKKNGRDEDDPEDEDNHLKIDAKIPYGQVTYDTYQRVCIMKPFGIGNKKPVFETDGLIISEIHPMSDGAHMRLELIDGSKDPGEGSLSAVGFGMGQYLNVFKVGDRVDIAYTLNEFAYRGKVALSLHLEDIRPVYPEGLIWSKPDIAERLYRQSLPIEQICKLSSGSSRSDLLPGQPQYAACYRVLYGCCGREMSTADCELLAKMIQCNSGVDITPFQVRRCLDVFSEAGILKLGQIDPMRVCFNFLDTSGKVNLGTSETYRRLNSYEH
ncbi:MAG: single-stranded-DNA-specific exonuclease RecJ [Clostridiales bacterium]|nr:single-stranded-DNA-specific exonuclease RecJ [Clostridiales bacterium]